MLSTQVSGVSGRGWVGSLACVPFRLEPACDHGWAGDCPGMPGAFADPEALTGWVNRRTHRLGAVEAFGHQRTRPALSQKWQRCTPRTSIDGSIVGRC